jgi:hypothetical protein
VSKAASNGVLERLLQREREKEIKKERGVRKGCCLEVRTQPYTRSYPTSPLPPHAEDTYCNILSFMQTLIKERKLKKTQLLKYVCKR